MNIPENSFTIRDATIADAPAIAALHVTTFNETHGSIDSPAIATREWQWKNIFQNKNDTWFCFVIEKENEGIVGFAKGQSYNHADLPEFAGELNKIYLLRKYQKSGLGRKLVCKIASEFIDRGINSMLLFGDAKNPSNGFYEHMGAQKIIAKNGEFHGGYAWVDLQRLIDKCKIS